MTLPELLNDHLSKVMLRVILNRLANQTEQIFKEERAGFRSQMSTTEQTFYLRLLVEKQLDHQKSYLIMS